MFSNNLTMMTDLYELTMMQGYFFEGNEDKVVFDVFYRKNPSGSAYAITCGLDQVIDYIKNLSFSYEDIDYLRGLGIFKEDFLSYLAGFHFSGDIYAIPEGSVVFPKEPLVKVIAPIMEAQLVETAILNIINHQSLIATKASRVDYAAGGGVMEFGLRRAQGPDAGTLGARAAVIGGCTGTSNVLAGELYGIPVQGTHAHSWIMSFPDELTAFRTYAKMYPDACILLVDTYDTLKSGVPHAIQVFKEMRDAGIEVRSFLKVRFPLFTSKVNYRNHRKIVVIDGRIGFVGGMNLAERYMRGFSWGIWRDTHIMLEGKAVHGLQTAFLLDWYFVDRTLITASRYFPKIEACGNSLVQIVTSEPIGPWKEIMQGLTVAISGAKKYFYMQTPYFLPTEQILVAMQTAALAGVDVRLMLPEHADNRVTHLGSCSYLADVLRAGVKVYFYKKGFLHSKLMVSDDMLSTVGSTNLDFRSFEHNFEVNAFMYDMETALQMREIFLQDQRESTQIFLKNWEKRSWRQKAMESVVRLLAPLL